MKDPDPNRISVVRNNEVVPLLPCAAHHAGEQPWRGVLLERHEIPSMEIPQHEHRELCLHLQVSGDEQMQWWSEGRHGVERTFPGSIMVVPPGTRDRTLWQGASERLIVSLKSSILEDVAESAGAKVPEFRSGWSVDDAALRRILMEMGDEAAEGWPLGGLYADLMATRGWSVVTQARLRSSGSGARARGTADAATP
ncbi:MAG TPA: hypothetical protein VHN81_05215 [Edaphobacter sp.]|nr:hypothetical protein [Edaphobacter sp.]